MKHKLKLTMLAVLWIVNLTLGWYLTIVLKIFDWIPF